MLELQELSVAYGPVRAVEGLSLHVAAGVGAPLGIIRALLAAHRRGSSEVDGSGRSPALAAAAAGARAADALALLLDVHPQARPSRSRVADARNCVTGFAPSRAP